MYFAHTLTKLKRDNIANFITFEIIDDNIKLFDGKEFNTISIEDFFLNYIIKKYHNYYFYCNNSIDKLLIFAQKLNVNFNAISYYKDTIGIICKKDKIKITISNSTFLLKDNKIAECDKLYYILNEFYKDLNVGCKSTISSLSLSNFRKNFMKNDIEGLNSTVEEFIRESYAGGRTEIFKTKSDPNRIVYHYDFNSMYPSAMLEDMPNGQAIYTKTFIKDKIGFYKCEVEVPSFTKIPTLYVRKHNHLIFPVGKFTGVYDLVELIEAVRYGAKIKLLYGFYFTEKEKMFKEYVEHYYNIKKNATDSISRDRAKNMINFLYGKFGQKREVENIIYSEDAKTCVSKGYSPVDINGQEDKGFWKTHSMARSAHIIPSISAHITALSRVKLHKLMVKNQLDLLYCAVDSIDTYNKLETGVEIGELKLEYCYKNVVYHLPMYYEGDLCDENGKLTGEKKETNVDKEINKKYDKRTINGIETKPINLNLSYKIKEKLWNLK